MLFNSIIIIGALQAALTAAAVTRDASIMPDLDLSKAIPKEVSNPTAIITELLKNHTPQELKDLISKVKVPRNADLDLSKVLPSSDSSSSTITLIATLLKNAKVEQITDIMKSLTSDDLKNLLTKLPSDIPIPNINLPKFFQKDPANLSIVATLIKTLNQAQLKALLADTTPQQLKSLLTTLKATTPKRSALDISNIAKVLPKETTPAVLDSTLKSITPAQLTSVIGTIKAAPPSTIDAFLKDPKAASITTLLPALTGNTTALNLIQTLLKLLKPEELKALIGKVKTTSLTDIEAFVKVAKVDDVKALLEGLSKTTGRRGVAFAA